MSLLLLAPLGRGAEVDAVAPAASQPEAAALPAMPRPAAHPAEGKFWQAVKLLRTERAADWATARTLLQQASDAEYTHAQVLLGNCLLSGDYGFKRNPRKAVGLFRLAATRGNACAAVSLGQCLFAGAGTGTDLPKAAQWLETALRTDADFAQPTPPSDQSVDPAAGPANATAGEMAVDQIASAKASAHYLLGLIAQKQGDPARALPHFEAAANAPGHAGLYPAAVQAALGYAFGQGAPRDMARATALLDHARQLGVRASLAQVHNNVALRIANDLAAAEFEEQMAKAAANDEAQLQFRIAQSFGDRKSKDYNPREAEKWYALAAESGQAWAMLALGDFYLRGELGQPEPQKAFAWFEKAGGGDQPKHVLGVANLAICLERGIGTAPDHARAAALFRKYKDTTMACYLGSAGRCPAQPVTFQAEQALVEQAAAKEDPQALFLQGLRCRIEARKLEDLKKAGGYFKRAAKGGHAAALCELGLLYEYQGALFGFPSEDKARRKAYECYEKSAAQENTAAMANLANCIDQGWLAPSDPDAAEKLYRRCLALEPDHARAFSNLGSIYERRLQRALKRQNEAEAAAARTEMLADYEAAAKLGFPYGARSLGDLYYEGKLVPQDYGRAYQYYSDAAEHGLPRVHARLGQMHEKGLGVPVTLTEAAYHYRLAAVDGDLESLRRLATFYTEGIGVGRDLESAAFWLVQLARRGQADAMVSLGDIALEREDPKFAFRVFNDLRNCPDLRARGRAWERLSRCYEKGLGVTASPAKAEDCLRTAIQLGDPSALYRDGCRLLDQGQRAAAITRLEAASGGSNEACVRLGEILLEPSASGRQPEIALRYLRRAADKHYPRALLLLARTTLDNVAGAPPLEEAIRFASEAENSGEAQAAPVREQLEQRQAARPESETEAANRAT